jgi:hypothetical protein
VRSDSALSHSPTRGIEASPTACPTHGWCLARNTGERGVDADLPGDVRDVTQTIERLYSGRT